MSEKEVKEETKQEQTSQEEQPKIDIKKLVSIVPPASELKKKTKVLKEKRIRIKFDESLPEGASRVPKELAKLLGIEEGDKIEIVVAGRKKFIFTAQIVEEPGVNFVYVYPEELREKGVADNSIATIRRHSG